MRYDPRMVQPMREELTTLGFEELMTPDAVDEAVITEEPVHDGCGIAANFVWWAKVITVPGLYDPESVRQFLGVCTGAHYLAKFSDIT